MSQPDKLERAANLFDLRRIIGGLFVCWGVLLVILGLVGMGNVDNSENINLFAGIGMLALGICFLLWAFTRPLGEELAESEQAGRAAGGDHQGAVGPGDTGRE
ncbi:MAG TPA: hypothetical protein VFZ00_32840 [Solirubrobacter sp.]|jgi:hypothetical protein|nr:hypothetical protein [Solirubrobacter sp.]